jgi:hypothetical protein
MKADRKGCLHTDESKLLRADSDYLADVAVDAVVGDVQISFSG